MTGQVGGHSRKCEATRVRGCRGKRAEAWARRVQRQGVAGWAARACRADERARCSSGSGGGRCGGRRTVRPRDTCPGDDTRSVRARSRACGRGEGYKYVLVVGAVRRGGCSVSCVRYGFIERVVCAAVRCVLLVDARSIVFCCSTVETEWLASMFEVLRCASRVSVCARVRDRVSLWACEPCGYPIVRALQTD